MFAFATPRPRRRPGLTPMIDVVFLLLVFFMLASQFGHDTAMPLSASGTGGNYSGPPRLIDIDPDGLRLNGTDITGDALIPALGTLMQSNDDMIILRGGDETVLQRLIDVTQTLQQAGFTRLSVVE